MSNTYSPETTTDAVAPVAKNSIGKRVAATALFVGFMGLAGLGLASTAQAQPEPGLAPAPNCSWDWWGWDGHHHHHHHGWY
jgi:hypothetical protein